MDVFPDVIRIEPVGKCNFECVHCPTGIEPNQRRLLKEEQFINIIEQFKSKKYIPRVAVLYHGGEPLLNKKITLYVQKLKELGVSKVQIVTNGSLLTKVTSEKLIKSGLDEIHISFDGESISENNSIRINGDFNSDASNVKEFYKLYKNIGNKNIRILISNIQIANNLNELRANKMNSIRPPDYLLDYFKNECPEIEFQSFPAMVWPGAEAQNKYNIAELKTQKPKYCRSLFETTTIMANGDVVPCCYDLPGEIVLGNVFSENIFDIWHNDKYTKLRDNFRKKIYSDLCKKCKHTSPRYLYKKD